MYGTVDVNVLIHGLQILDMSGVEIMENVKVSKGVQMALDRGPEIRPCYCWRDLTRRVLINGGDQRGSVTARVEVEDNEFRYEGVQCTWFLSIQARLLMNARSSTSKKDTICMDAEWRMSRILTQSEKIQLVVAYYSFRWLEHTEADFHFTAHVHHFFLHGLQLCTEDYKRYWFSFTREKYKN